MSVALTRPVPAIPSHLVDRFWNKVNKTDSCWQWMGASSHGRYGSFGIDRKIYAAHRVSWKYHFGDIPDGLLVCHRCDNVKCVNPKHLFLGTQFDNMQDCSKKKRSSGFLYPEKNPFFGNRIARVRGELHGASKLSKDKVMEIRKLRAEGKSLIGIADQFKVCRQTIANIVSGKIWRHV